MQNTIKTNNLCINNEVGDSCKSEVTNLFLIEMDKNGTMQKIPAKKYQYLLTDKFALFNHTDYFITGLFYIKNLTNFSLHLKVVISRYIQIFAPSDEILPFSFEYGKTSITPG